MSNSNSYLERTCRNHYWLGGAEAQKQIANLKVGIAGLGGMGSGVALTLARLGVTQFHLADPDIIEKTNINRQVIASHSTIGRSKLDVTIEALKDIDPGVEIKGFPEGITDATVNAFLDGVDVVIDEIDVFPVQAHKILHKQANQRNLDIYSAYVIGLGIHCYRFSPHQKYNIEEFYLPIAKDQQSLAKGLIDTFVRPIPNYFKAQSLEGYTAEVESGNVPIFGPSCLLGHSLVSLRMVFDYMVSQQIELPFEYKVTPMMPEFVVVDPVTLSVYTHNLQEGLEFKHKMSS